MDDLISRKQAIDACMKYNGYGSVWACIMGDIKQLPSVTIKDTDDKIKVTNCNYNHIAEVSKKGGLISRQDAIDAIDNANDGLVEDDYTHGVQNGMEKAKYVIEDLPSAQPEIIHCKDCKYYTPVTAHCEIRGKGLYLIRGMEDYCSRAERKDE